MRRRIPCQALTAADGERCCRADDPPLLYAPSATILLRPASDDRVPAPEPCLALAYNGAGETRLQFGEDEAQNIVQLMGGSALTGSHSKTVETVFCGFLMPIQTRQNKMVRPLVV